MHIIQTSQDIETRLISEFITIHGSSQSKIPLLYEYLATHVFENVSRNYHVDITFQNLKIEPRSNRLTHMNTFG